MKNHINLAVVFVMAFVSTSASALIVSCKVAEPTNSFVMLFIRGNPNSVGEMQIYTKANPRRPYFAEAKIQVSKGVFTASVVNSTLKLRTKLGFEQAGYLTDSDEPGEKLRYTCTEYKAKN